MTNFEKLLENDKERIIEVIAEKCCIDTNKHKIKTIDNLRCGECIFRITERGCSVETKKWLESEVENEDNKRD